MLCVEVPRFGFLLDSAVRAPGVHIPVRSAYHSSELSVRAGGRICGARLLARGAASPRVNSDKKRPFSRFHNGSLMKSRTPTVPTVTQARKGGGRVSPTDTVAHAPQ